MKCDILATGKSCRARWTAVDSSGPHGINERVVRIFLPMAHRIPTLPVGEIGRPDYVFRCRHDRRLTELQIHHTPFLAFKLDYLSKARPTWITLTQCMYDLEWCLRRQRHDPNA